MPITVRDRRGLVEWEHSCVLRRHRHLSDILDHSRLRDGGLDDRKRSALNEFAAVRPIQAPAP